MCEIILLLALGSTLVNFSLIYYDCHGTID